MKIWRVGVLATLAGVLAGCRSLPGPEEMTDDGLVRVASRASGGVFRKPDAQFVQYKRLILEPPVIAFKSGWRKQHSEVTDADVRRIRDMASESFREEFERALITKGGWQFAENPDADVLIVEPRIVDLDIPAPDADRSASGTKTYTTRPVQLQVIGDLRDARTGVVVGRVDLYDGNQMYGIGSELYGNGSRSDRVRIANNVSNLHEMRMTFGKWSRLLRESLDVAKATRPHRTAPEAGGDLKPHSGDEIKPDKAD